MLCTYDITLWYITLHIIHPPDRSGARTSFNTRPAPARPRACVSVNMYVCIYIYIYIHM